MAFHGIAEIQATAGDSAGAKTTASEIDDEREKAFAYMTIAATQAKTGDAAGARATIEKAKTVAALSPTNSTAATPSSGAPTAKSPPRK